MGDWITREEAEELEGLIWALNNAAIEGNELAIYLLSLPYDKFVKEVRARGFLKKGEEK